MLLWRMEDGCYVLFAKIKQELNKIIEEAIQQLEIYGEKAEFLSQLATYIKNRNK